LQIYDEETWRRVEEKLLEGEYVLKWWIFCM